VHVVAFLSGFPFGRGLPVRPGTAAPRDLPGTVRRVAYGDLISVDRPVEDIWFDEGGGQGRPAWFVRVRREGYAQEFWFSSETAATRFADSLARP
jgi:hypothetical protein